MINRLRHERTLVNGEFNEDCTQLTVSNSIRFKLPPCFPFSPPILYIDSIRSDDYLTQGYRMLTPIIKKYNVNLECFCCTTIACMWSPCNTCKQLYDEYRKYKDLLKQCANLTYLSKLPFDDYIERLIASYYIKCKN